MISLKKTLSWRSKLLFLMLLFAVGPVLVVAWLGFGILAETHESSTVRGLQALARAKAGALDQFTDIRRRDVERMASLLSPHVVTLQDIERARGESEKPPPKKMPQLRDAEAMPAPGGAVPDVPLERDKAAPPPPASAMAPAATGPAAKQKAGPPQAELPTHTIGVQGPAEISPERAFSRLKQTLGLILWDQREFEELLVLDAAGRVVAATFKGHEGTSAADLDYFKNGARATFVQPVFMSPITEQLTMMISTPVRNEKLETVGVLAARLNLKRFFELINDTTGLGETGETVVAKKIGDEIVLMAPTRNDADAALKRKIPVGADHGRALQEAARGQSGAGEHVDYRGIAAYAAWQYVPSLEWGLLSKIDKKEAAAAVSAARERTLVLTAVIILLIIPASMAAARALVQPLKDLKEATDRLSRGDFAVDLNIHSNDEIGDLADSFERMVAAIKFFREQSRGVTHEPDDLEEPSPEPAAANAR
jgi:HAMP domain-containing protein